MADNIKRYINKLEIGLAIASLKKGAKLTREVWPSTNDRKEWIELINPSKDSEMTLPYIYLITIEGDSIPWVASQADILAGDWQIIE